MLACRVCNLFVKSDGVVRVGLKIIYLGLWYYKFLKRNKIDVRGDSSESLSRVAIEQEECATIEILSIFRQSYISTEGFWSHGVSVLHC
jgi:hypothetical protein